MSPDVRKRLVRCPRWKAAVTLVMALETPKDATRGVLRVEPGLGPPRLPNRVAAACDGRLELGK